MQAAEIAKAAAATVCDVPDCAPDKGASYQQNCASVGLLSATAGLHRGPLHQLPGLRMVKYTKTPSSPPPRLGSAPCHMMTHVHTSRMNVASADRANTTPHSWGESA